ncbi:ankyrin repeat [Fusarium sporotrichioides]|uniref:Ankyrin repeat n=1 Tax=Fusarium sporotrichioides TaxID=5514 RepID=A0A395S3J5_FUSSP|nr:ankyrin repeat [Fusarium sporotrichioides]
MSGLDVASLALAATQICAKLAVDLYEIIKAVDGATSEARKTCNDLFSLRTRLENIRFLFQTTTAQDVAEESFRNSIMEILENIDEALRDLRGKLRIDSILSSKTYIGKAWDKLAIRLDEGDIKSIQARIASYENGLQTYFSLITLSSQRKTQRDFTDLNNNFEVMKTLFKNAQNNERLYRMEVAESCTSRMIQHEGTSSSTDSRSIIGSETGPQYLIAIERWLDSIDLALSSNQQLQQNITSCSSVRDEDYLRGFDSISASPLEDQSHFTAGGAIPPLSLPSPTRDSAIGMPKTTIPSPDLGAPRIRAWCKEQGFDINSLDFGYDRINDMVPDHLKGFSPIHQAINTGENDVLKSMLSSPHYDLEVRLETRNDNATPLLLACSKRNTTALQLLLERGALRNTTDNNGKTGLHRCQSSVPGGKDFACLLLDSQGVDSLDVNAHDQYGMTAVHMAARMGDIQMLEYLLGEKQADANSRQPDGSTPLILALKHNKINPKRYHVASTLLKKGADVTLRNNKGETAKDIAKLTKVDSDKRVFELLKAYKVIDRPVRTSRSRAL